MSVPAVLLQDLRKTFAASGGTVTAVDGVDVEIGAGEVVALLGPNGAGKTTTLDVVLGLAAPTSGHAEVLGLPPRQAVLDGRVAAVLQTGGLLRDLTVSETVELVASTYARPAPVAEVMARAGVADLAGRLVSRCSGGEQQRLRFALALLPDPELLVLDEPTAGMDVTGRREFWATMHADSGRGRTVVFATHYLEEADDFADRIVLVAAGRVVADGPTAEIRAMATGRVVHADLPPGLDAVAAADVVRRLERLPGVGSARLQAGRLEVRSADSDLVARVLLTELGGRNLEVATGSLEDAFVQLTASTPATSATAAPEAAR
ncbi:ABC transporter ATP-binding protein [Nocardioides aurantiacus]|uniref:ABC-2 type transport system ATP-binding protein n=1 Tax=Nocardioides aurantiacus TaxID=86796 RepID=A0A3N2CU55_9ACTN|nr:ABC transporter ATP-binding protein [Nocardioides aurantiacus]ROR91065.1 ABC-2 type transport system ATP-binding protein [Nocardioides aurantiacus]